MINNEFKKITKKEIKEMLECPADILKWRTEGVKMETKDREKAILRLVIEAILIRLEEIEDEEKWIRKQRKLEKQKNNRRNTKK